MRLIQLLKEHLHMRESRCFVLAALILIACSGVPAQSPFNSGDSAQGNVADRDRFEFEKYNEQRKAQIEIWKGVISGIALLVPLLIGVYSIRAQSRMNFELKAAEIVMNARNVFGVRTRADVLRELFRDKLPRDFSDSFDPKKYAQRGPSTESKLELLKLIVAHPEREKEIVQLWRRMYTGDALEQLFPGDFPKTSDGGSRAVAHDA
jgi:hypothetical protein